MATQGGMDGKEIRQSSIRVGEVLGFVVPEHLPLSGTPAARVRSRDEVVHRAGALHAVVAVAFGLGPARALAWLAQNSADGSLTGDERRLLSLPHPVGSGLARSLETRIEALWALCWALGHVEELDFASYCGDDLAEMMPDLEVGEPLDGFAQRSRLRAPDEIAAMEDLAYCLDWAVVDARLRDQPEPGQVRGYVVRQRRHALSWLLCAEDWDDVPTDT